MEKFYTCEEVAERLGVRIDTVWGWVRNKNVPAIKSGKQYCIEAADLERLESARNEALEIINSSYSCKEIAERHRVEISAVQCWIREKRLPAIRINKKYYVKASDLEEFERVHRTVPYSGEREKSEN